LLPFKKLVEPLIEDTATDVLKKEAGAVASKVVKPAPLISKTTVSTSKKQLEEEATSVVNDLLGITPKPAPAVEQTATALAKKRPAAVIPDIPLPSTKRPVFQPTSTSKVVKDEGLYLGEVEKEGRFVDNAEPVVAKQEAAPAPEAAPTPTPPAEEVPVWKQQYDLYTKYAAEGEDVGDFDPDTPFSWNNPEKQEARPAKLPEAPAIPESKVNKGDLNQTSFARNGPTSRKQVLSTIRELRTDTFDGLVNLPKVKELQDAEDVMAVVQGDFRLKEGREINLSSPKDVAIVEDMATTAQKRLDALRVEYKDTPPIKLYHGKDATWNEAPTNRFITGFEDPQKFSKYHSELEVGGTSFTRDLNLNFETPSFGGTNPNKFLYTEMPYADYMFKRINMTPTAYEDKNLNVIAQSINGSDRVIRPVSIPRSASFKETEDMITETDKLRPEGKGTGSQLEVKSGKNEVADKSAGFLERRKQEDKIKENIISLAGDLNTERGVIAANKIYTELKNLLNNYLEKSNVTSTNTGMGQRYHQELTNLGVIRGEKDVVSTDSMLKTVSTILEKQGSKEKATLLRSLRTELRVLEQGYRADAQKQVQSVNKVRELTQKFAKGGLASRKS
jgi:hypothetical protein